MTPSSTPRSGRRTFGAGTFLYAALVVVASLVVRLADPGTTVMLAQRRYR